MIIIFPQYFLDLVKREFNLDSKFQSPYIPQTLFLKAFRAPQTVKAQSAFTPSFTIYYILQITASILYQLGKE